MNTQKARVLVIGPGVNGSICAAALRNAGIDVTVLARGKRLEEIRNEGIVIDNFFTGVRTVTKVPVIGVLEPDDVYDYILVVVRKNQARELLPVLSKNKSPAVVLMFNNPSGPDEFAAALGRERVMIGFVFGGGTREGSVIRGVTGAGGIIGAIFRGTPFGETDGSITPRLKRLVDLFRSAGLGAKASSRTADYLATHAALITIGISLAVKYELDIDAMALSSTEVGLVVDAVREIFRVLPALGYRVTPPRFGIAKVLPRFILVAALRAFFRSKWATLDVPDKNSDWRDSAMYLEWKCMAEELGKVVDKAKVSAPSIRKVLASAP